MTNPAIRLPSMHSRHQYLWIGAYALLFSACFCAFYSIIDSPHSHGDLKQHVAFAQSAILSAGEWPRHFLYTLLLGSTSALTSSVEAWNASACFWLSVFVCWKARVSELILIYRAKAACREVPNTFLWQPRIYFLVASFTLILVVPLPSFSALNNGEDVLAHLNSSASLSVTTDLFRGYWYRYSFPPNVWHNSTVIILMPIALLTFFYGYRFLCTPPHYFKRLIAASVISAFAKPSFLMAWLPIFFAISNLRGDALRRKMLFVIATLVPAVIVLTQFFSIYVGDEQGIDVGGVKVAWLVTWKGSAGREAEDFFDSIILALLFPITFYISSPAHLKSLFHLLPLGMTFFSFLYAALLAETGSESAAGNFMWSAVSSVYILHLVCLADLCIRASFSSTRREYAMCALPIVILVLEFLFGTAYIARYVLTGVYY